MWGFFAGRYPRSFRSSLQPANMLCSPRAPVRVKLGFLCSLSDGELISVIGR